MPTKPRLSRHDSIIIAANKTAHLTQEQDTWLFITLPMSLNADSVDMEHFVAEVWQEDTINPDHFVAIRTGFTHWLDFGRR